jgi:hypothetical protein
VLVVHASSAKNGDVDFDLSRFVTGKVVTMSRAGRERVLISDGPDRLCFEVRAGSLLDGPVHLDLVMPRLRHPLLVTSSVQHLLASAQTGVVARRPFLSGDRPDRWRSALMAWDAHARGASQREIGVMLFGTDRIERDWNQLSDSLRSQVRRLLRHADHMVSGGWRDVLVTTVPPAPPRRA